MVDRLLHPRPVTLFWKNPIFELRSKAIGYGLYFFRNLASPVAAF